MIEYYMILSVDTNVSTKTTTRRCCCNEDGKEKVNQISMGKEGVKGSVSTTKPLAFNKSIFLFSLHVIFCRHISR